VLKWPDAHVVMQALRRWTEKVSRDRLEVVRIGFFGSYARGDWGVGSDLDLIIILADSRHPFELRPSGFNTLELPVPTDVLVYTQEEWQAMKPARRFFQELEREGVWVYTRNIKPQEAST
jgi:predicted nucleotidyltransferase